ncbi:pyridoxal phosphate-dependent transferase [Gigaspora rosea]|uniref:Pyridoxal phosphate-dependent transferase n=1 Tax=Gigaspora rosea TaxID=44941 RepID=A0A397U386_9GLOM|nr:pyridoxal phosphate-dependent transferase [Gigaspora rosea]
MDNLNSTVEFGHSLRSKFLLEDDFIPLNNGSFGAYPKVIREALNSYREKFESNPDLWIRRNLGIDTTGINAVLKSIIYESGDKIIYFSTSHNAVKNSLQFVRDRIYDKLELLKVEINYPISDEELISKIIGIIQEEHQKPNSRIKLAVVDAISSVPGAILPLKQILSILRQHNILSVVDGAQSVGQIPLDLKDLDPDYFVTSCHKWLYCAFSVAILYVPERNKKNLRPPVTSVYYDIGFTQEFSWVGAQDYSSYLTVLPALEFRRAIGGEEKILTYCHDLAVKGGKLIASILGTEIMGPEHIIPNMVNIRLPVDISNERISVEVLNNLLFEKYRCYVLPYKHNGYWYIRASAQIYNDLSDFENVGKILKEICESFNNMVK